MHVAITGAAGKVGRVLADGFDSDRLTLLTHADHDDIDSQRLDGTDRGAFLDALDGVDALVHLAWVSAERGDWTEGDEANIRMLRNALEAARENDLDRVVVASSAHVVGMYNREDPTDFEATVADPDTVVDTETPPRPDSTYGVSKVACEALCTYYADRHGVDIVVVRIGWLQSRSELRERRADEDARERFARAMWLSHRDCRALFHRAVHESIESSPFVAHGISRNGDRYLTLTETMQCLAYRPRDDASEVLDGDSEL